MKDKLRIAIVKFGGLSAGGTQRWLQIMAAGLDRSRFAVDYFYCDTAPYIGSDYRHPGTDPARLAWMQEQGVNLIEFHVGAKDITVPTHDWVDTDFWDVFDEKKYDLVQTAKAGPPEYPFTRMSLPVVEFVSLLAGVDRSSSIAWSIHISTWQWIRWCRMGGSSDYSSVIPVPVEPPCTATNLRAELDIPPDAVVAGFHQRPSDEIASSIPLAAFARLEQSNRYFVLMGGGQRYREQANALGLKNIRFLPACANATRISAFLNTLDIFAHGRKDGETFGTVLAEAMLHGKPCLSHRSDIANAQPETMGPGGLFAENAQEYTEYLERLFSDASLRQRLGTKGKAHAKRYYAVDGAVRQLESIYETLAGRSEEAISTNAPYGLTELGYLQAGDISSPASIAYNVMTGGIPEPYDIRLFSYFLPQMRVMLDVGANIGLYCCLAARRAPQGIQVHAFEPQPDCCDSLKQTVFLNNWEKRLLIHCTALGQKEGRTVLHLSGSGSSCDNAFIGNATLPHIEVPVTTIDLFCEKQGLDCIDFIKIDVGGGEFAVLKGGEKALARFRPVVYMEMAQVIAHRGYTNPNFAAVLAWLAKRGYAVWRNAEDKGLVPVTDDVPPDGVSMYLCLPREREDGILVELTRWQREYILLQRKQQVPSWRQRMIGKARSFAGMLLRDPRAACGKLARKLINVRRTQVAMTSYEAHDTQLAVPSALVRHRATFARYRRDDQMNIPTHRHRDLLEAHPEVRAVAVDIGSGAGWCSAELSHLFQTVYSLEPSQAGQDLARQLFPEDTHPNIVRLTGLAENLLDGLALDTPAFFVANTVLSHLPDADALRICQSVCRVALPGSILSFGELWGTERHEPLWHVRPPEWWRAALPGWCLDFHGPLVQPATSKGFHGVLTFPATVALSGSEGRTQ